MSKNARNNPARRAHLIAAAELADWGLDGSLDLAVAAAQAQEKEVGPYHMYVRYVSAAGLTALVADGAAKFTAATGQNPWPHNLAEGQGRLDLVQAAETDDIGRGGRKLPVSEADSLIETAARLGGWLAAAAKLPALRRTLLRGLSPRGLNAGRTAFSPALAASKFPSPGNLNRRLAATRRKADAILSGYAGQKASWGDLMVALMTDGRPNKAALIAAALTLGWDGDFSYESSWMDENGVTRTGSRYRGVRENARGHGRPAPAAYSQARAWLVRLHGDAQSHGISSTELVQLRRPVAYRPKKKESDGTPNYTIIETFFELD